MRRLRVSAASCGSRVKLLGPYGSGNLAERHGVYGLES
jgi:hypothetical protein